MQHSKRFGEMSATELWAAADRALRMGKLRDAKEALDEMGLRFDDAYARLESEMLKAGEECTEGLVLS